MSADKRADVEADLVTTISALRGRASELDGLLVAAAAKEPSKGWVQFQVGQGQGSVRQ
jgi:hypothetical protein